MKRNKLAMSLLALTMLTAPLIAKAVETNALPQKTGGFTLPGDNDSIYLNVSVMDENNKGKIKFCLSSSQNVTWWKGLKVFGNKSWSAAALLVTQDDDHGEACRTVSTASLGQNLSRLEFWKAKAFGVHTHMASYTFYPSDLNGKDVHFTWQTD